MGELVPTTGQGGFSFERKFRVLEGNKTKPWTQEYQAHPRAQYNPRCRTIKMEQVRYWFSCLGPGTESSLQEPPTQHDGLHGPKKVTWGYHACPESLPFHNSSTQTRPFPNSQNCTKQPSTFLRQGLTEILNERTDCSQTVTQTGIRSQLPESV